MTTSSYEPLAEQLLQTGLIHDPWIGGTPRFRPEPVLISEATREALVAAAEAVGAVYDELCQIVAAQPLLLDSFFGLTPVQKLMWEASRPRWHGLARADVFQTATGLQICELNCDTPTGEPEAVLSTALAHAAHPLALEPNSALEERLCGLLRALAASRLAEVPEPLTVSIVYPTDTSEDLPLVQLYHQ